MSHSIRYEEKALVITIPTEDPAELHYHLLNSVAALFKQHLQFPVENAEHRHSISSLAELQLSLMPTKKQLEKLMASDNY